jgi:hypothetical protein
VANQDERTTTVTEFVGACLERHGPPGRPLPIVLLVGRRGTGKTALLDRLQEKTLTEPRPYARLDVGYPGDDPDPDPLAILAGLMAQLHPHVKYVGTIPFPRFGLGLLALDLNPADKLSLRRADLGATLEARDGAPLVAQLQPVLADLTANLPPGPRTVLEVATWLAGGLIPFVRHRQTGKLLDWYAARSAASGGAGQDTLYRLSEWRATAGNVWRAEKALCAAFLADLQAHFDERKSRLWQPVSNCLVLLDNTGGTEATRFLETLAECRAEMPGTGDPLVVVAGHQHKPNALMAGRPAEAIIGIRGPADATIRAPDHKRWLEETRSWANPPLWYPVRLADQDEHGVQLMVPSRVLDGKHGHDADFIGALTGGHLGSTAAFAAALVPQDAEPVDPRDLCRDHDRLLRLLLPSGLDDTTLDAMAVCAATPGLRLAACTAVSRSLPEAKVHVQDIRGLLTATMWAHEQADGDLDLHLLPRRLLLARLAEDPFWWRQVHESFQDYYRSVGHDNAVKYHTLACEEPGTPGELGRLTTHMVTRLDDLATDKWCGELDHLTAAPNRIRTRDDPWEVVTELAGPAPEEGLDRRQTVARLIVAEWLHQDRIFDPRHKLTVLLNREYLNLAGCVKPHGDVFVRRAEQVGAIAREWGWIS